MKTLFLGVTVYIIFFSIGTCGMAPAKATEKELTPAGKKEQSAVVSSASSDKIVLSIPADFTKRMREATFDYYSGNFTGAIDKYLSLIKSTGSETALANLATVYKDTGFYSDAVRNYEAALRIKEDSFWRLNLGYCRFYMKDFNGAEADLENVLNAQAILSERDADALKVEILALFGLGLIASEKKEDIRSVAMYKKVLELDIRLSQVHLLLGDYYLGAGDIEKALVCYRDTVKYDKSYYKANLKMAEIYNRKGKYAEAFENYKKVSYIEPGNKEVQKKLGETASKAAGYIKTSEAEKEIIRKKTKSLTVDFIKDAVAIPLLEVELVKGAEYLRVKCAGKYNIYYGQQIVGKGEPEEELRIAAGGALIYLKSSVALKSTEITVKSSGILYLVPELKSAAFTVFDITMDRGYFWANEKDRSYRGVIKIAAETGRLRLINEINLEEYLYSVVPSEIGSGANIEALKAQAVVARSYIYRKIEKNGGRTDFHLCADVHCQAYAGIQTEQESTTKAVDLTRGEVASDGETTVPAYFFSSCGGRTADVSEVWGGDKCKNLSGVGDYEEVEQKECYKDWPLTPENLDRWIKLSPGAYCSKYGAYRWFHFIKPEEAGAFKIIKRDTNGYVRESRLGAKTYLLDLNRGALFGLRSSFFKVENNLVFGCGWGHGVGMCQEGAKGMAAAKKNYKEIITRYYKCSTKKVYG
ncbi:MAG: SpoIID/LytB domain-containing protein [Candidatus Firestonebacteria bacterium]|nr:SpoIID/LytB domain-containing protein [Candidatus Firestonebacteria bacterium]